MAPISYVRAPLTTASETKAAEGNERSRKSAEHEFHGHRQIEPVGAGDVGDAGQGMGAFHGGEHCLSWVKIVALVREELGDCGELQACWGQPPFDRRCFCTLIERHLLVVPDRQGSVAACGLHDDRSG
jgi:hypothetical protein